MGVEDLVRHFDRAIGGIDRKTLVRALVGLNAQSQSEAALHDLVDLIPIIGDFPSFARILWAKGNRLDQAVDAFVGLVPVVGDAADLLLTGSTNIDQFEEKSIQEMGPVETALTLKFVANWISKNIGGDQSIKSIWKD